jgi:hypothetical protein
LKNNYKILFFIIVFISILIATFIKVFLRSLYHESNQFFILLLGSLPSFFYVLGISFIFPLLKKVVSFKQFLSAIFFIALGSIIYETEQIWTNGTFDYFDIIASITAAVFSIFLYKKVYLNKNASENS